MKARSIGLALLLGATAAAPAMAQPVIVADSGDSAWVLAAAALVLLTALPGLTLLQGRGRAGPTAVATLVATAATSLVFAIIGYSLAFGDGSTLLGGAGNAMLAGLADLRAETTIPESLFALFQMVLAIFAVAIVVSSLAERTRIGWLVAFVPLWLLIGYVPVARWLWGGGWLAELGGLDYAGGIVIQTAAGVATLVVALLLGRQRENDVAHDSRLGLAGVTLIWVGWFGVVGGGAFAGGDDAASAIIAAQLAASMAALVGLLLERLRTGTVSAYGAANAAVAGLAAVSAGAGFVAPLGAMLLGLIGAIAAWAAGGLIHKLRLGGAANGFVTHGAAGMAGAVLFPVFILPVFGGPGFDVGTNLFNQLAAQTVAVVAVALWVAVLTAIAALMVSMMLPMRWTDQPR